MKAEQKKNVMAVVVVVIGTLVALTVNAMFSLTSKVPKVNRNE